MKIENAINEIKQLNPEGVSLFLDDYKLKGDRERNSFNKRLLILFVLVIIYYLLRLSFIEKISLPWFTISQIKPILVMTPFLISYLIYDLFTLIYKIFHSRLIRALLIAKRTNVALDSLMMRHISETNQFFAQLKLINPFDSDKQQITSNEDDYKGSSVTTIATLLYVLVMAGVYVFLYYIIIEGSIFNFISYELNWFIVLITVVSLIQIILGLNTAFRIIKEFIWYPISNNLEDN